MNRPGERGVLLEQRFLLRVVVVGLLLLERRLAVLADHHERRQEDRFQRHDERERRPRALLDRQHPDRERGDVDVDEHHRPRERRDRVGDAQLEVGRPLLEVFDDDGTVRDVRVELGQWAGHERPPVRDGSRSAF
jgi:hypothetical protein